MAHKELTWCWCPGTSAVVNWVMLYSRRAGRTPAWSESSSEMMFRTSGEIDGVVFSSDSDHERQGRSELPLSTSLISPGGD